MEISIFSSADFDFSAAFLFFADADDAAVAAVADFTAVAVAAVDSIAAVVGEDVATDAVEGARDVIPPISIFVVVVDDVGVDLVDFCKLGFGANFGGIPS